MLSVRRLNASYGRAHILCDLDFEVGRGEAVALLGRNGAGKATTLRSSMGLVRPSSGEIVFDGRPIHGRPVNEISRLGLGYVPEDRRIFAGLTVAENLEVGRQPPRPGVPCWAPEDVFALFPMLAELRRRLGGRLSGGEQQMLAIARTLLGNPAMLLLDEPSEGLAPVIVEQMARAVARLKREGLAILLSEQNLRFASAVTDRAYIVETGRIRYRGTMREMAADEAVRVAYLTV